MKEATLMLQLLRKCGYNIDILIYVFEYVPDLLGAREEQLRDAMLIWQIE